MSERSACTSSASDRAPRSTPRRRRSRRSPTPRYVVGYRTYIGLVKHLLDGKEVMQTGMTEEIGRARAAVERARGGRQGGADLVGRRRRLRHGRPGLRGAARDRLEARRLARAAHRPRHHRDQLVRLARGRAAGARLLLDLAVGPADAVAGHRAAHRGRRRRRLRRRALQPGERPAHAADPRGAAHLASSTARARRRWRSSRAPIASSRTWC